MTAQDVARPHEHSEAIVQFRRGENQDRPRSDLKPARFGSTAKVLHWVGYGTAGLCLLLVMTGGGGLLAIFMGAAAAFVGAAGGAVAESLGPNRLLKGIGVREVLTRTCLTVPYYTRLGDLFAKHSVTSRCCCVVTREGYVLGVLNGDGLASVDLRRHSDDTVEWHMHPVDWIEAVDIADEAAEAWEWMKRYRRDFLPVLDGTRLIGIVTKERIVDAAFYRQ